MIVLWVGLALFVGAFLGAFALALCVIGEDKGQEDAEDVKEYDEE